MYVADLKIIGINPYVEIPEDILNQIYGEWGKALSPSKAR